MNEFNYIEWITLEWLYKFLVGANKFLICARLCHVRQHTHTNEICIDNINFCLWQKLFSLHSPAEHFSVHMNFRCDLKSYITSDAAAATAVVAAVAHRLVGMSAEKRLCEKSGPRIITSGVSPCRPNSFLSRVCVRMVHHVRLHMFDFVHCSDFQCQPMKIGRRSPKCNLHYLHCLRLTFASDIYFLFTVVVVVDAAAVVGCFHCYNIANKHANK